MVLKSAYPYNGMDMSKEPVVVLTRSQTFVDREYQGKLVKKDLSARNRDRERWRRKIKDSLNAEITVGL